MDELVRETRNGWTFSVGRMNNGKYLTRIESPEGEVTSKGPFAADNEARVAMAEARNRVTKGDKP